ncbi:hypothetical protein Q4I30_004113 [Leishmania utingensis]|uniref:Uncharacterized protein n=2 Tax=Viannia TaxID=37616 RepID=A0AAW3AHB7_9TRYP
MLYSPSGTTERFCYSGAAGEGSNVEQGFRRVAASYVSSPYEATCGAVGRAWGRGRAGMPGSAHCCNACQRLLRPTRWVCDGPAWRGV